MPTPRPVNDLLEAQIALARVGISAGSIDGVLGSQTRAALRVFQAKERIPVTGKLDLATRERLKITDPILTTYTVRESDVSRLGPVPQTWLGKSQLDRLGYETLLELVAEKSCAHPELIQKLNPGILFPSLTAGAVVNVLNLTTDPPVGKSAFVEIYLAEKCLEVFDAQTNLLAHFPCSIAQRAEKRPIGQLTIKSVVPQPHYVFDPAIFPESAEGQALGRKLVLPPGPNCPVGTVWIGLDRPGYGIHGTPRPEDVGRTESHGCFRLSNWNAEQLMQMVEVGTPVNVKPSHTANWQSGPRSQP
jgi:lipoprotein-anchoring transpeptidase ErfK/SrfK